MPRTDIDPITGQPKNQGTLAFDLSKEFVNTTKSKMDAQVNCALCTAAGVLNLSKGINTWTTGMVAISSGLTSTSMGADNVDDQARNIMSFCQPMTGRRAKILGSIAHPVDFATAKVYLDSFPVGTVFAIYISGYSNGNSLQKKSHWLNAVKRDGGVEFVDYQSASKFFIPGIQGVATGSKPIVGILGESVGDPEMVIVVFH